MAVRNIRVEREQDEILRKKSREVDEINERIITLLDDMAETLYKSNGVGLAAPQVGVLKRVIVADAGDGLIELINPKITRESGEQIYVEGCLSLPNVFGEVKRPEEVLVEGLNRDGKRVEINGSKLLAVVLCHEIDHLDGVLFTDKAIRLVDPEK